MGEVHRARDTKLDRDVALKILPESFASDPDRLMRVGGKLKTIDVSSKRVLELCDAFFRVRAERFRTAGNRDTRPLSAPSVNTVARWPERTGAGSITIIQHWLAGLKQQWESQSSPASVLTRCIGGVYRVRETRFGGGQTNFSSCIGRPRGLACATCVLHSYSQLPRSA